MLCLVLILLSGILKVFKCPHVISIEIRLRVVLGKNLKVPVYELLGGKVRNEVQVYCWIGGDRPSDVENAAYVLSSPERETLEFH